MQYLLVLSASSWVRLSEQGYWNDSLTSIVSRLGFCGHHSASLISLKGTPWSCLTRRIFRQDGIFSIISHLFRAGLLFVCLTVLIGLKHQPQFWCSWKHWFVLQILYPQCHRECALSTEWKHLGDRGETWSLCGKCLITFFSRMLCLIIWGILEGFFYMLKWLFVFVRHCKMGNTF